MPLVMNLAIQTEFSVLATAIVTRYGLQHQRLPSLSCFDLAELFKAAMLMLSMNSFIMRLVQVCQGQELVYPLPCGNPRRFLLSAYLVALHPTRLTVPTLAGKLVQVQLFWNEKKLTLSFSQRYFIDR